MTLDARNCQVKVIVGNDLGDDNAVSLALIAPSFEEARAVYDQLMRGQSTPHPERGRQMIRKSWSPRSRFISVLVRDPYRTHCRNPFRVLLSGPPSEAACGTSPAARPPAFSLSGQPKRAEAEPARRPARAGSTPAGAGLSSDALTLREALTLSVTLERMRAGEAVHA